MNVIEWKNETKKPEFPRFTAFINNKHVAFASFIPLDKKDQFYSYHHSLFKDLDGLCSKDFTTLEECKSHTQKALDQIVKYAKTRTLVWHYPNSNSKTCNLIFENTTLVLASVEENVEDYDDLDYGFDSDMQEIQANISEQGGFRAYLYLYSVDEMLYDSSYKYLKEQAFEKIYSALKEI